MKCAVAVLVLFCLLCTVSSRSLKKRSSKNLLIELFKKERKQLDELEHPDHSEGDNHVPKNGDGSGSGSGDFISWVPNSHSGHPFTGSGTPYHTGPTYHTGQGSTHHTGQGPTHHSGQRTTHHTGQGTTHHAGQGPTHHF